MLQQVLGRALVGETLFSGHIRRGCLLLGRLLLCLLPIGLSLLLHKFLVLRLVAVNEQANQVEEGLLVLLILTRVCLAQVRVALL